MLRHRVAKSLLWSFAGAAGRTVLYMLVLVVLARLLTPEDFGILAAALIVVRISNMFSQLGVGAAIVQREKLDTVHVRTGVTLSALFGVFFGALVWFSAPAIAAFFRIEELRAVLEVVSLIFPVQALSVVADSLLQRELKFRRIALAELAAVALGPGLTGISLALAGCGVWSLIGAQLAQTTLRTIFLVVARPHTMMPLLDRRAACELVYFGTGQTGGHIFAYLAGQADNLVVGRWLGAAALGVYGRAHQIMVSPVALFCLARDKVLFSTMSTMQSDPVRLGDAYRRGITLTAIVVLPISVLLCVLTPEVVAVLLGPGWSAVVLPGQILAMGIVLQSGHRLSDSVIRASGRVYHGALRQGLYAALVILGTWVGQHWGIGGAAAGVLAAVSIHYLIMAQFTLTITRGTWSGFVAAHLPSLGLTTVVGLAAWTTAGLLRGLSLSPFVILPFTLAVAGVPLLLVVLRPEFFLGEDAARVLNQFRNRFRSFRTSVPEKPQVYDVDPSVESPGLAVACDPPVSLIR
ncbi:MAG: lipopolysaccharide biosynthesis protein [Rhodopirellula sp.]|nr:lipopolysaccharide biosynthesis protein [Rhodopirellula sp.]